ncbi:FHA domain-containing protein [Microbacterium trichothecenolyticum]|uniref:zinc ribbon domain-containing protein n=1 Tax=Microbacterium trichothecenolyticum TaxID=69370 RepID=UPI001C6ED579|nr:zinc ribbon domain-containing protein [Microbacterium trichothecenolyticum]MBW9119686.1 FHA domain-containing protein [Microbacterium trichothecenolyticum]
MTTHCRFCGEAVRPNTMFCPSCGQIIVGDAPRPQSAPPFPTTGGPRQDAPAAAQAPAELPPVPLPDVPAWVRPVAQPPAAAPAVAAPTSPAPAMPSARPAAAPAAPGPLRTPPPASAGSPLALLLPGGARIPVDRVLVLGRQPAAGAAQRGGVPVEVADPSRSMSRVHLVVQTRTDGGTTATDPGSGNGTVVVRAGKKHPLIRDVPFELAAGDRLALGDVIVDVA